MAKMTKEKLIEMKRNYIETLRLLNNQNIAAAVDYFEKIGVSMLLIDQKAADKCFEIVDRTSNFISRIENRIPSTYEAFNKEVDKYYYFQVLSIYLKENDKDFQEIILYSSQVINACKKYDYNAFEIAYKLDVTLRNVDYTIGRDYFSKINSLSRTISGLEQLILNTQEYCGKAFKKMYNALDNSI